jgi:hypothetical protein
MKIFLQILLLASTICSLKAQSITQEVVSTGGGYHKQINGSLQFTIAEPIVETYKDTNSYLTQGFQQSNYNIVGLKENKIENVSCEVFPNPASEVLKIKVKDIDESKVYTISITDVAGRLIKKFDFKPNLITEIKLSEYENASYFININCINNNYFKSYKIQKIN